MQNEQPKLLEKFLRNERRSKFWTLLGVIAFCLVSFSVIYVAKTVSSSAASAGTPSKNIDKVPGTRVETNTITIHDTTKKEVTILVDNPKEAQRIRDSFNREIAAKPKPVDYFGPYQTAVGDYNREKERADALQEKLDACKNNVIVDPPKPEVKQIALTITTTYPIPDTSLGRLKRILRLKGYMINIIPVSNNRRNKTYLSYYSADDEKIAGYILKMILNAKFNGGTSIEGPVLMKSEVKSAGQLDLYVTNLY